MEKVSIQRLGDIEVTVVTAAGVNGYTSPVPYVLWSNNAPAAVLTISTDGIYSPIMTSQRIGVVGPQASHGWLGGASPFPLTTRHAGVLGGGDPEAWNGFEGRFLTVVDLDGDGTDELIVPRSHGTLQVVGVDRHRFEGGPGTMLGGHYEPRGRFTIRLGGRDTVFFLHKWRSTGDDAFGVTQSQHPDTIWRVDSTGVSQVQLRGEGWAPSEILAVGALNLPGSKQLDEILVLYERAGGVDPLGDYVRPIPMLSRHRPDGALLAPPRQVYTQIGDISKVEFGFVPASAVALLVEPRGAAVHFLSPHKPANWARLVNLSDQVSNEFQLEVLDVSEAPDPKVLFAGKNELYWVNEEGQFFRAPQGRGPWQQLADGEPWHRIVAPGPAHALVTVQATGQAPHQLLLVHSRDPQVKSLTLDEWFAVGRRFLPPREMARLEARREPKLKDLRDDIGGMVEAERERRGVTQAIETLDEWKALLPDSYAKEQESADLFALSDIKKDLVPLWESPMREDFGLDKNPEYKAWRASMLLRPELVFSILDGDTLSPLASIAGSLPAPAHRYRTQRYIPFRITPDMARFVLPMSREQQPKGYTPLGLPCGFYTVSIRRRVD